MRKKDIRCVLRHGLILVTILLCLFAVCATPAAAVDVYEEVDNYDGLFTIINAANLNPSDSYTIVITESFPMGYAEIADTGSLTITGNVTLTTNETHPRTLHLVNPVSMFTIENGGKLTICGNNSKELTLRGMDMHSNSLINVNGGTFTMKANSTLTENNIAGNGGAVSINGGEFVMKGGTISYNTAMYGGAVLVNSGVFVMEDGAISHNTAMYGGGVQVHNGGIFKMSGGEISVNHASVDGEGVIVFGGTFEMSGGKITRNTGGNSGVALSMGEGVKGKFYVKGSAEITDNAGKNIYTTTAAEIFVNGVFTGSIGVSHGYQQSKAELIRFATAGSGYTITADDAKHFFADDSINYSVQLREDGLYLVSKVTKAADPPKQTSVWIAAPVNSKLGSGVLDDPNGGKINFPEGFPFDSVTINQAGEVTQSSPSSAESEFPVSDTRQILASADITANPSLPSDGAARIEFSVPIEKIPDGYTVGVYHGVIKGKEDTIPEPETSEILKEEAVQAAYDAGSKAWEASNEVFYIIEECNRGFNDPSFNLEAAYYALQESIQKAKEAIEAAREAAAAANVIARDEEAQRAALDAATGSERVVVRGEDMMAMIVEKLGYVPQGKTDVYAWKAEKVIETGRSDGLIHYAVEVNGLSPFIIVIEQGGAEPVKEYDADVVPPLDIEPSATPTETPAPLLGVLMGILAGFVVLRRR